MSRCESIEFHYLKYVVSNPRSNKVSLIIYLLQESRRTIAPSIQRRTFGAGCAEKASNARTQ